MSEQLPLGLQLPRERALGDFLPGPNAEALTAVRQGIEPYLYLWGEHGTGKTHLLLGAARAAQAAGQSALYLDLGASTHLPVDLLDGLEDMDLVCLDDVQSTARLDAWEQALFYLFNQLRDAGRRLLVSGDAPAAELPFDLPDLRSRLTWGPGFRLRPLDDESRLELLYRSAARRGMPLAPAAARYILNHCPRDLHYLESLLDRLDDYSLAQQKKPTIALIQRALEKS